MAEYLIPKGYPAFSAEKIIINADGTINLYICVNDHNTLYYDFEMPVTLLADTKELHKFLLDKRLTIPIDLSGWTNIYLLNNYRKLSNSRKIEYRHMTLGWQKSVPKNQQESVKERNIGQRALDTISEFIFKNRHHFNKFHSDGLGGYKQPIKTNLNAYGTLLFKANKQLDVYISEKILKDELLNEGFGEYRTILTYWRDDGLIRHENKRFTQRMPKLEGLDSSALKRRYIHLVFMNGIKDLSEENLYEPYDDELPPEQPNDNGCEPAPENPKYPCDDCAPPEDDYYFGSATYDDGSCPPEDIDEGYTATRRIAT